jgi:hypothetical protein
LDNPGTKFWKTHSHPLFSLYDSWELGTRAQALLELSSPEFSVLTPPKSSLPFPPPPSSLNVSQNASLVDVFTIARSVISSSSSNSDDEGDGGEPLLGGDGSAGDPASIGIAVLIANWTQQQQEDDEDYAGAATAQVEYLIGPKVPKTIDGAISHRVDQLQLWYVSRRLLFGTLLFKKRLCYQERFCLYGAPIFGVLWTDDGKSIHDARSVQPGASSFQSFVYFQKKNAET